MRKLQIEKTIFIICLIICLAIIIWSGLQVKAMQLEVKKLEYQNSRQAAQLLDRDLEIEIQQLLIEMQDEIIQKHINQMDEPEYIGTFTVTHYCLENYPHICNDGESLHTASGETPIPYYTVAADESIEFGTKLIIDGQEYEVMDRGGYIRDNKLDIAVPTHAEAVERGVYEAEVYLEGGEG